MPDRRTFLKTSAAGAAGLAWVDPLHAFTAAPAAAAAPFTLRFRQVHLDFHTSPLIPDVAKDFDPERYADTLARAHVDSVTTFARCHHGLIYYDTKAFPERRHPNLRRNLLPEQVAACHRRNIRVPIYVTVQWDQFTADAHPEWRIVTETGALEGTPPYEAGFYRRLCLNSPYPEFLKAHVKELFEVTPVDGLFLDIVAAQDCSCVRCRSAMASRGIDPSNAKARQAFGADVAKEFRLTMTDYIRQLDKSCSIFYNAGHVGPETRPSAPAYTHFELESLPSGGWGYLHFPLSIRYARTLGRDCLGMTGKFHTSWGDFHSLKNPAALQFECFQMLANAAKCSVGDQLHPRGALDAATYELIGSVYASVEQKEPWCREAHPIVDIGVFSPEEFTGGRVPPPAMGVARILQEGRHQFDVIDTHEDLQRYKVVVLPDEIRLNPELASRLQAYLDRGGSILASSKSGLTPDDKGFALPSFGVTLKGDAPYSPDFIRARPALSAGLPSTELVMYLKAQEVTPAPDAEVLADVVVPYFNRTWEHYSSHRHTPSSGVVGYAGVVRKGRVIYFAHPVFTQYAKNAPRWCKTLVLNALDQLLPSPVLRVTGPSTLVATVNLQASERRRVVHLLNYIPERRGTDFDVIEDVIPVRDLGVTLQVADRVRDVQLVPQRQMLKFEQAAGSVTFTVPVVEGHQMVSVSA